MKTLKYLAGLAVALLLCACEIDIEKAQLAPESQFRAPELLSQGNVIVNADNSTAESVVFNWSSADFGAPVQINYALYAALDGKVALLGNSFTNSLSLSKTDLNGLVCGDLGVLPNKTANIQAYVEASVYGTDIAPVRSNTINFDITTFAAALRCLYLPGNYQGWTIASAPAFWETDGGSNIYKTLVDLQDGSDQYSYFKVTVAQNWSDENWGYNYLTPGWHCPEQSDSNLSVDISTDKGSIVELTVNRGKMTIDRTYVDGVGMCGAYNGWAYGTQGDDALTYDWQQNCWVSPAVTFTDEGGLGFLIRLNTAHNKDNWDDKYGTSNEASAAVPGGLNLVKGGDDIKVPAAGTYVIKFYGNRTPYVIAMEKQ